MADGSKESDRQFRALYGWAELSPRDPIEAGSVGSWSVTYHVGRYGIDDSGMIRVARRFVSDWGKPQGDHPEALDHVSVSTTGQARVRARYDSQSHVRPWEAATRICVFTIQNWSLSSRSIHPGESSSGSSSRLFNRVAGSGLPAEVTTTRDVRERAIQEAVPSECEVGWCASWPAN